MPIKPRLTSTKLSAGFLRLSLLAVLLAACAPNVSPPPAAPTATFPPPIPTLDQSNPPTPGPTQDLSPTALPIATSRGPNLEATDPSTVELANGQIQFVEFFRFT
jgi:hypothetical protein